MSYIAIHSSLSKVVNSMCDRNMQGGFQKSYQLPFLLFRDTSLLGNFLISGNFESKFPPLYFQCLKFTKIVNFQDFWDIDFSIVDRSKFMHLPIFPYYFKLTILYVYYLLFNITEIYIHWMVYHCICPV